ncbi:ATP-binding protein [Streptomyces peucetius subsp. caesius ATCC 27952]|nr:ATP-binding protein [Streptomyces peucetius subsp. caesius ATCC 27952]
MSARARWWPRSLADLAVVVVGESQGSGVLITPGLVLTSAHVVGARHTAEVARPGRRNAPSCPVVWSDPKLDAAVLMAPTELLVGSTAVIPGPDRGETVRVGDIATDRPLSHCEIVGYPDVQRYDGERPDVDQFSGTLLPAAGLLRRTMVFEFDRPPAAERPDGTSPLAGLSGAPVFSGSTLLGIVSEIPRGRNHYRAHCVSVTSIVTRPDFREWWERSHPNSPGIPPLEELAGTHPDDMRHEEEYADAVGAEYRRTRIFGLDELSVRDSEWDLDTAYLTLEATPREDAERHIGGPGTSTAPQRIDALLASRPRILLRGEAGAGKTTLVWWLAAHAAAGTLGPQLAELNGLVPFVIPLRTLRARGGTFPSPAGLPDVADMAVDRAPDGWAGRVLKAGRALLLVDGLDEVPQPDREEAHQWLSRLLRRYPATRCIATVRPLAVEPDWLKSQGFEELRLLPMRDADVQAFVTAWHRAARLEGDDREDLPALERDLTQQFAQNPALRDLAGTPLLCAVICALNRLRQGFLPETRWALYRSALEMLLGQRDKRRRIGTPEGITMTVEEHQQLLQRIAVWLVRGGQTEFTRGQALRQLESALAGMPQVRAQSDAAGILIHLLNRSGLLQERADGVYQFAHRTFQDFLAAKEFVEGDHLNELLRHAPDQQWHDVLLLAAGHCSRRELPQLVNGLLTAGSSVRVREGRRTALYVLAALCAQHAAWLDGATHHQVRVAVRSMLPPRDATDLHLLARLGPYVLPLLPDTRELAVSDIDRTVDLVSRIGGPAAIPYAQKLAAAADDDNRLAFRLARSWVNYPVAEYAQEVLLRLDLGQAPLFVTNGEQLARLPLLPHARHIDITGDFSTGDLTAGLAGGTVRTIGFADNGLLGDLDVLLSLREHLEQIAVRHCPALTDLSALPRLGRLSAVHLDSVRVSRADLETIARIPRLRVLSITYPALVEKQLNLAPLHRVPGLSVRVSGLPRRQIVGREAFGDRLGYGS